MTSDRVRSNVLVRTGDIAWVSARSMARGRAIDRARVSTMQSARDRARVSATGKNKAK